MSQQHPTTPDRPDEVTEVVDELEDRVREEHGDPLAKAAADVERPPEAPADEPPA
jgi:hypothetical protein